MAKKAFNENWLRNKNKNSDTIFGGVKEPPPIPPPKNNRQKTVYRNTSIVSRVKKKKSGRSSNGVNPLIIPVQPNGSSVFFSLETRSVTRAEPLTSAPTTTSYAKSTPPQTPVVARACRAQETAARSYDRYGSAPAHWRRYPRSEAGATVYKKNSTF